jgi:hypothetical protein
MIPEHDQIFASGADAVRRWKEQNPDGRMTCNRIDLRGANLAGRDMSDISFQGANFAGADLQRADLRRSRLPTLASCPMRPLLRARRSWDRIYLVDCGFRRSRPGIPR